MDNQETQPNITAFFASAMHDMKNSLSVLINFLESYHTVLDENLKNKVAPMLYEVKRVNNNLVQMLAIYKVGNEFYPFEMTENSIDEFVSEIVMHNQTLLDDLGVTLELDYDKNMTWYFDRELVSGVTSHALNNAMRYTHDKLRLFITNEDGYLVIRVEDNGTGYSASMLDTGNAVNKGVNFASGSTGLGLFFTSMVAKLHKHRGKTGSMALENGGKFGGGCFVLRLP
ncbi:MAG TPA: HAMP domain-containing sensor histidine kinase [Sulfuricella sp.]|nr:HAMP domain-containing sensor histidine kinase [Sulfuricella sp.]